MYSLLFIALLLNIGLSHAQDCSPSNPCAVGCCSTFGFCGFGPDFCEGVNCQHTCDAKAECGQYAQPGQEECPLNVCCSEFGFCGTTDDFCGTGCQSGCDEPKRPACSTTSSDKRTIGYYESWNLNRPCDNMPPYAIELQFLTHINFAFANIGADNRIAAAAAEDIDLYKEVTALKERKSDLEVWIAVGGWAAGGGVFSNMASTAATRATFIQSAIDFMDTYAFDGIDIDWEYPGAEDRGGVEADTENYVLLLKELRQAVGRRFGISIAIPSSYWYLQHFDLSESERYVDWFNFMSYDIHGTWDGKSQWTEPLAQPHTNLSEIAAGLDLVWREKVAAYKMNLGLAFYGRAFTLENPSCNTPGCRFAGGAAKGECTGESGILSNAEIIRRIDIQGVTPILDAEAGVKYVTFDNDQWVSYDDAETFAIKKAFANSLCIGGTMIWAIDLDDGFGTPSLRGIANAAGMMDDPSLDDSDAALTYANDKENAILEQNAMGLVTFWTDCQSHNECPAGFNKLSVAWGVAFDAERGRLIGSQCEGSQMRVLCIEHAAIVHECHWFGTPKECDGRCPKNHVRLGSNSGPPHQGYATPRCKPRTYASYCCRSVSHMVNRVPHFCPNTASIFSGGSTSLEQVSRLLSKKAGDISFAGPTDFLDLPHTEIECNLFNKGFGAIFQPKSIPNMIPGRWMKVGDAFQFVWELQAYLPWVGNDGSPCQITSTISRSQTTFLDPVTTDCDGNKYPQACQHYASVINNIDPGVSTLNCPFYSPVGARTVTALWNAQHHSSWRSWVPLPPPGEADCQRDEYPFFRFMGPPNNYYQAVRFLNGRQNGGAAQIIRDFCSKTPLISRTTRTGAITRQGTCTETVTIFTRVKRLAIRHIGPIQWDYGLSENTCRPKTLLDDPGFALFTNDPWYRSGLAPPNLPDYAVPPPLLYTQGKIRPRSLDVFLGDPEFVIVDEGNSSRKAGPDDLFDEFGLLKCESENCEEEKAALGLDANGNPILAHSDATSTPSPEFPTATPVSPWSPADLEAFIVATTNGPMVAVASTLTVKGFA